MSVRSEGARVGLRALAQERSERPFEAGGRVVEISRIVGGEVDRSVEHHATHAIGELLRVDRPDDGPVRVPDVVEPVGPERRAQAVEVAGDVAAPDPGEPRAVLRDASRDEVDVALGAVVELPQLGVRGRRRVRAVEAVGNRVADAIDGTRPAGAARVEAHEVVAVLNRSRNPGDEAAQGLGTRVTRSAEVEHQGSEPVHRVQRASTRDRDGRLLAVRCLVVDRHRDRAALEPAATRLPADRAGVGRCHRRGRRRRRGAGTTDGTGGDGEDHEGGDHEGGDHEGERGQRGRDPGHRSKCTGAGASGRFIGCGPLPER